MNFKRTTSINKLLKLTKRIRVIPGGSSAGKTFGILPILIDKAIKVPNLEISVVSESIPHLRKGALKDFLKIMKVTNRYIDSHYNRTLLTYTFANNSYIEFFSVDQEDKVRGPRRNELYINEGNNIKFETYHQLAIRTSGNIWVDFNPSNEFWAHNELLNDEDAEWLRLTYKDNEALPESIIKEIEKAKHKAFFNPELEDVFFESNIKNSYWSNWWKVYGLGLTGSLEGVIFSNWSVIDNLPNNARLEGGGIDFGFTNDPSTVINAYRYDNARIYDEVVFEKGLLNNQLANRIIKSGNRSTKYFADSAEPKSISELKQYGLTVLPALKGADSIRNGINLMQKDHFYVTARSTNMISELRKYSWDKDKEGNKLNKPIDEFNHTIDASRYFEQTYKSRVRPSISW